MAHMYLGRIHSPLFMRCPALLLAASVTLISTAQTSKDPVQDHMARRSLEDMALEDDHDPFVPNTFIGSFRMETHRFTNGMESKPNDMLFWSSPDKTLMQMYAPSADGRTMRTMTDLKDKWTYMLMDDGKGKRTAMKAHKKKLAKKEVAEEKRPEVTVTNETRTIDGHVCTKVIAKTANGTWTGWVAKDVPAPFGDLMRSMQGDQRSEMAAWREVQGFPLEYEWVGKDAKDKVVVYTKDLKLGPVDESIFSLEGYEVVEMPGVGR